MDSLCFGQEPHISPAPTLVETSCSDQSDPTNYQDSQQRRHSNDISEGSQRVLQQPPQVLAPVPPSPPSAVNDRRSLSTAIATERNADHPALVGRQTLILPNLPPITTPKKLPSINNKMAILPKCPNSAPAKALGRASTIGTKSVAPLPPQDEGNSSDNDGQPQSPLRSARYKIHRAYSDNIKNSLCNTTKFRSEPHPLRLEAWSEPAAENFQVRGPNYMSDRKKVPSEPSAFTLLSVDLVNCEAPMYDGICNHPEERVQKALRLEKETGERHLPEFVFCVNLCVPGQTIYHQATYFGIDNLEEIKTEATPFGRLMNRFIFGDDDEFRNKTFKLIPRIVEGNYIVRKAVGSKPSILGKKIKQKYIRGDRFFELIVDIASDTVAQRIVKLCLGYTKTMVVDMMYLLEGTDGQTLPERVFGGVRMKNIDFIEKDGKRTLTKIK